MALPLKEVLLRKMNSQGVQVSLLSGFGGILNCLGSVASIGN